LTAVTFSTDGNTGIQGDASSAAPRQRFMDSLRTVVLTGLTWGTALGLVEALPALLEGDPLQNTGRRLLAWLFVAMWSALAFGLVLAAAGLFAGTLQALLRRHLPPSFVAGAATGLCAALSVAGYCLRRFTAGSPLVIALLAACAGVGIGWLGRTLAAYGGGSGRTRRRMGIAVGIGLALLVAVAIGRATLRDWKVFNPRLTGQTSSPERPNIVLISIDVLRPDHLGAYGYEPSPSPRIDELARQGIVFRQAISQGSATPQSVSSFMTSLYPTEVGFFSDLPWVVDSERVTMAEALQAGGYRTQGYVANGHLGVAGGFAQGFDGYDPPQPDRPYDLDRLRDQTTVTGLSCRTWRPETYGCCDTGVDVFCPGTQIKPRQALALCRAFEEAYGLLFDPPLIMENGGGRINTRALRFIRLHGDEQFFLWLHYMEPHASYSPSQPFGQVSALDRLRSEEKLRAWKPSDKTQQVVLGNPDLALLRALYDGEIQDVDRLVGQIWDQIVVQGIAGQTLLVITADHGDEFGEHGDYGHGQSVYQELVHVPLIFVGPQVAEPGSSVDIPVPLLDLLPTLVDVAGAPMPELVRGQSLLPVLSGEQPAARRFYSQNRANRTRYEQDALFDGYTKVIYSPLRNRTEMYDLRTDPGELNDRAGSDPQRAAVLRQDLVAWQRTALDTWAGLPKAGVGSEQVDQAMQDALKRIGY